VSDGFDDLIVLDVIIEIDERNHSRAPRRLYRRLILEHARPNGVDAPRSRMPAHIPTTSEHALYPNCGSYQVSSAFILVSEAMATELSTWF
jgi:hypothetical protein